MYGYVRRSHIAVAHVPRAALRLHRPCSSLRSAPRPDQRSRMKPDETPRTTFGPLYSCSNCLSLGRIARMAGQRGQGSSPAARDFRLTICVAMHVRSSSTVRYKEQGKPPQAFLGEGVPLLFVCLFQSSSAGPSHSLPVSPQIPPSHPGNYSRPRSNYHHAENGRR